MIDKEKVKKKLLKELSNYQVKECFICKNGISRFDIDNNNFEKVDNRYIHSNCFNSHVSRID